MVRLLSFIYTLLIIFAILISPLSCSKTASPTSPSPTGALVSTLAGQAGVAGLGNGLGASSSFNWPCGVAVDASGNVYIADTWNNLIRKISPRGEVSTLAGSGEVGSTNATGTGASFNHPFGIAVDARGYIYVADTFNQLIREITPWGLVTTLAGSAGVTGATNAMGTEASFNVPRDVAVDSNGNVYVADNYNQLIRKIFPNGAVTTLAGSGTMGSQNGTGSGASFTYPSGIAADLSGNVYVVDYTMRVRKISPLGVVTTLAGTGAWGDTNGPESTATFDQPEGIAVDVQGNVYVGDTYNQLIRKITPEGWVTNLAGTAGVPGATNGAGSNAAFNYPHGVAVDSLGNVYVADMENDLVRKIQLPPERY